MKYSASNSQKQIRQNTKVSGGKFRLRRVGVTNLGQNKQRGVRQVKLGISEGASPSM